MSPERDQPRHDDDEVNLAKERFDHREGLPYVLRGDEVAILLPNTDVPAADVSLQRVRHVIRENNASQTEIPIRISMGVSTADKAERLTAALMEADSNMYREKRRH